MHNHAMMFIIGVSSIAVCIWLYGLKRRQDKFVDKVQLPEGWSAQHSVPLSIGGTVDLMATSPAGTQYAVTIKTQYKELTFKKSWFEEKLALPDGRLLNNPCPIDEASSTGQVVGAAPVLWFPRVPKQRPRKTKKGVLVVFGPQKILLKALKA